MTKKLIYVSGAGHSGSTLFDVLLTCHPDVLGLGEVHRLSLDPSNRKCGCGAPLERCDFWNHIIEEFCNKEGIDRDKGWGKLLPLSLPRKNKHHVLDFLSVLGSRCLVNLWCMFDPWSKKYWKVIGNSWSLYNVILNVKQKKVVVDSTKTPLRGKCLYLRSPRETVFVHVVRDGRAVSASMMRREKVSMSYAAEHWRKSIINTELSVKSVKKSQVVVVRYEDLCDAPVSTMNSVSELVEIDPFKREFFNSLSGMKKHQIPGNPVLFSGINGIKRDDRWQNELSKKDLDAFEVIAGAVNRRYGYD